MVFELRCLPDTDTPAVVNAETTGTMPRNCHSDHCFPLDWRHITQVTVWAWHSTVMAAHPEVSLALSYLFVLWVVEGRNNIRASSKEAPVSWTAPSFLEVKMGQSHTRPAAFAPLGARPPSPRTVCALRLAEPPQRFCCHYQHFSYPERTMSYSPPYSPSLFKRPDRR